MKKFSIIEILLGIAMDVAPLVCAAFIVLWAGRAYAEGYGLFVPKAMDKPGEAHSEMVTITEQEAGSALAVGRALEKQKLVTNGIAFFVKAKLSGYDERILPGTYVLSSDMTAEQILEKISVVPGEEAGGQQAEGESSESARKSESSGKENKDVWGQ